MRAPKQKLHGSIEHQLRPKIIARIRSRIEFSDIFAVFAASSDQIVDTFLHCSVRNLDFFQLGNSLN
jgi:hypothetical protein